MSSDQQSLDRGRISVLYIINAMGTGGAERSLAEFLGPAREQGVDVRIVCRQHRREGVEGLVTNGSGFPRFLCDGTFAGQVLELRRLIGRHRPHLIHTTLFEADLLGRLAAAGSGVPVLTSLVNTSYGPARLADPNVRRHRLRAAQALDGWTARHLTAHFHAITQAVKQEAVRSLGIHPEQVTVVYRGREAGRLGAPSPARRAECRRRLGLAPDAEVVLNVGRQEFQKGQQTLLRAARSLLASRPKLVVLVAGRYGNASPMLRSMHDDLHLGDRVRFLGHRDDVPDLLAAADVFAFPSVYEGLGGAAIEAMALGLPIVASRIPTFQEILEEGENALLVAADAPEQLAAALTRLLDDDLLARSFARRSREIFLDRFTLASAVDGMTRLYRRVARQGPNASLA